MQLNIHDSTLKKVGYINNDVPGALHYFDDNWHRYLAEGTSTFDFSVNKVNPAYSLITLQSYISFSYDNEDYLFNIINLQQDHYTMQLQCENLNLELISEEVGAYSNTKRHSIVWYLKNAAKITDDVLEIGNNPFSEVDEDTGNPILTFDSTETKLARIISICNSFNAEFRFKTELKDDGTLQSITLDLYKSGGVGQVRKDVTLFYGKNVVGITSTGDRTSTFFNATTVTDSNKKYNWKAIEGKYYNSDGKLEFYKKAGENTAYAILSRDMFPSQLKSASADRYTRKDFSIEASSADSLWDYAVSQFKLYAYPQMTYDVVVSVNAVTRALGNNKVLDIGDTVTIQDSTFDKSDGGLILSARVSEQEISFTNPANNKITFSNFVRLKSQISADLLSRMKDIVNENTPYRAELETTNGVQFKNSAGSTTLTARIYKGSEVNETIADVYEWFKDGISIATGQEWTVSADDIDGKAVYAYEAALDDKVVGRKEVTITDVSDGIDGRSIVSVEQKYQTTTIQKAPTDKWDSVNWQNDIPFTDSENKYLWQINHITYNLAPLTSDSISLIGTYGDQGETSYTHVAYANSADGTDGFTTVYPNLNLLTDSKDFKNKNVVDSKATTSITSPESTIFKEGTDTCLKFVKDTQNKDWFRAYMIRGTSVSPNFPNVDVKPNTQYTFSVWLKGTGTHQIIAYNNWTNPNPTTLTVNLTDAWTKYVLTVNTGTTIPTEGAQIFIRSGTVGSEINLKYPKAEPGSTATPWMPSSSEVTTADYPSFIGQYTDFAQDDSTNPSDYTWSLIRGNDGKDGENGKDGNDAWNLQVTNQSVVLPANAQGGVQSYANSGISFSILTGSNTLMKPVTSSDSLSDNEFSVVVKTANNITAGMEAVDTENNVVTFSNVSEMDATPWASASITWKISVKTNGKLSELERTQYFTKSQQGITGNDGADTFTYIRYSNKSDGSDMVSLPNADSRFIGVYTGVAAIAPTDPKDYTWSRFNGATVLAQDTEPEEAERFTGMLWQYTGTEDLSATGITVEANTIYQWTGKVWQLFVVKSTNLQVDNGFITNAMIGDAQIKLANIDTASINKLSVLSADLGEATAGSITLLKGETGGVSVKDGVVKTWDISKVTDPNYPDGYSYTSMGTALDSGGITFYSAGYGQKLNQEKVIDDKYKIATLSAVAGNGRQDGGVGLVLDASNPNFPLNIIGNVRIQDTIDLGKVKSVEVPLGWGRSVILTRVGNQVTMFSNKTFSGTMNQGLWSQANEKIPNGYKPYGQVYIYSVSIVNQSKFMWYRLGPSGGVEIWQNGNITTNDTMITPVQSWITSDGFPS